MARPRFGALLLVALLTPLFGCHRSPDPAKKAEELLKKSQGDDEWARNVWKRDAKNWDLGLKATVAWKGPDSSATIETVRDLRTEDLSGCLPKDFSASAYFRTTVTIAKSGEGPIAVFHWLSLDAATAGQKKVQAAVAATQGDEQKLYEAIQHEPSLDKACVRFAGRRELCGGGGSSMG
jgi:hypothetical protein